MGTIRDIKRTARGGLHREMSVPALYIPAPDATPVPVTVRVWRKREDPAIGDMPGSNSTPGQMVVSEDRIRFDLCELSSPRRNAVVSVEPGEAYRIDYLYPADLGYQTARVVPLSATDADGLAVPQ